MASTKETSVASVKPSAATFEHVRSHPVAALNIEVEEYRHRNTGAVHYHLSADNPENVFLVAFRTVPMDSSGVAHILEHTALCGSEKYPVRDPFFMMIRRSLNTFMNAFTSSDWTAYPFASQNRKDFNNLLDVYLDAAFFSRLHELDFAQEGHRVEFENPEDPQSPLVFKGVVFNEMKGAMSSPVSQLWQTLTSYLFPTTTYHYNSGGDPAHIPDLSYEQLQTFYRTHYHPSNAIFMTYGDIPASEHQKKFEEQVLSRFEPLDVTIEVGEEKRFDKPQRASGVYALDEHDLKNKTHVVMAWLLGKCTDALELMRAHLLSSVLLDNGASPLRYALETTELGSAPSPLCGLEDSNMEMALICGLEGSEAENADAIEKLVLGVIKDVATNGVARDKLESVLHQLEIHQREISGDSYPYGLQLILEALPAAIHRGDPVALLDMDGVLNQLRKDIADPEFIKRLAREWLLENPHRVLLTLQPDPDLNRKQEQAEKAKLKEIKTRLAEPERENIINLAHRLAERQNQEDDPEILPKVGLDDVPKDLSIPSGMTTDINGHTATVFHQGTNGLVYEQVVMPLPQLDDELLEVLPLYGDLFNELGVGNRDYLQVQEWQDAVSGGISFSTSMRGAIDDEQQVSGHLVFSGKALNRNADALGDLMQQTLNDLRFDETARMREVIAQMRARAEQRITGNGHALAMGTASSRMSPVAWLSHRLRGLQGINRLKEIDTSLSEGKALQELADRLARLHKTVLQAPRQFLVVAEKEEAELVCNGMREIWAADTGAPVFQAFRPGTMRDQVRQVWTTSTQVQFCAKAYATVPVEHDDAAALTVLGGFLRNGYLHRAIREQGGAYGGGASQDSDNACFRFFSYRDPRSLETLEDFDRSLDWVQQGKHEWREVEEAILGVVANLDKPGSPAGEAKKAFHNSLYGRTPEQRRRFRSRVLEVTLRDLQRVSAQYLDPQRASIAVITSGDGATALSALDLEVRAI